METKILTSQFSDSYEQVLKIDYYDDEIILNDSVIMNKEMIKKFINAVRDYDYETITFDPRICK